MIITNTALETYGNYVASMIFLAGLVLLIVLWLVALLVSWLRARRGEEATADNEDMTAELRDLGRALEGAHKELAETSARLIDADVKALNQEKQINELHRKITNMELDSMEVKGHDDETRSGK